LGLPEEEDLDMFNEVVRRPAVSGTIIEFIKNEFENETIANLSPLEYMDRHIPEFTNI
jgi:hypothetical protein